MVVPIVEEISQEYHEGYIPGNKDVPLQEINRVSAADSEKNITPLFVCCYSGVRSRQAVGTLQRM